MTTLAVDDDTLQIEDVEIDATYLHVRLRDGRQVSMPLWWSPRLLAATPWSGKSWTSI